MNIHFNSIKVQLERMTKHYIDEIPLFQFHKGTIRTLTTADSVAIETNFNSIKVQLELIMAKVVFVPPLFQFHKGTIRTAYLRKFINQSPYFNSIKVQLEPSRPFSSEEIS